MHFASGCRLNEFVINAYHLATIVSCIIILCYSFLFISNRCVCHDRISTMGCLSAMCVCFRSKKKNKKYSGLFYIRISSSFNSCLFVSVSWNELSFILNTILSRPPSWLWNLPLVRSIENGNDISEEHLQRPCIAQHIDRKKHSPDD